MDVGTDVAMEAVGVVLMSANLQNIAPALDLARYARRVIIRHLGFKLPLPTGVVSNEGSAVFVGLCMLTFRSRSKRQRKLGRHGACED